VEQLKILCVGDFHGKFPAKLKKIAKSCDLILATGDYGGSPSTMKIILKYFGKKWWDVIGKKRTRKLMKADYDSGKNMLIELSTLKKPVYCVMGNWDFYTDDAVSMAGKRKLYQDIVLDSNMSMLQEKFKRFKGIDVFGFGEQVPATLYTQKKFSAPELLESSRREHADVTKRLLKKGKKGIDIFLAHYPPYKIFDKIVSGKNNPNNGKHVGFKGYNDFMNAFNPRVFVCGHMHEHQGSETVGKTLVVATGAAKEGKAAVLHIDKKSVDVEFIQ